MDDQQLFSRAIEIDDADQRAAFLDRKCSDSGQRRRLDDLLASHDRSLNLSELPTQPAETGALATQHLPIEQIGPYKILEPLGEGGMGSVFMADQEEPVRRRVAIKVIKPGMDSRQIIARFEAERQALALMNHEHIAKVFDAGTTEDGRPYFVMELVQGIPITEYCDQHRLNTEERLNLVIPVCQAIQHAHQKGVIHRDIKPSNVLVAEGDSGPVPKVIDFGLAKALQQQLTDSSVFTQFGQVMGTLEYMSPEQAELNVMDIDTRTDVYAIGVLLYELLTGSTPIGRARLKSEAFDRILQLIREEEPPRPSTRLSDSHDALPALAAQRRVEPRRLSQILRGDLDAIVMKALDKNRARRYESATGLAADIRRYLMHEPIEARAPSAGYRLRKIARKYRAAVATTAAFLALLLVASVLSTWLAVRARNAEALARTAEKQAKSDAIIAKEVSAFLQEDLLAQANPLESTDRDLKLRTVLDRAAKKIEGRFPDQPLVEASIRSTLGAAFEALGEYDVAEPHLKRSTELRQRELGAEHPDTLTSVNDQGNLYFSMGRYDDAESVLKIALETGRRVLGEEDRETLTVANNLSMVYYMTGRLDEAAPLIAENLKISKRVLGADHEDTVAMVTNLGTIYEALGRYEEALPMLKEANASFARIHGPDHPHTLATHVSLGRVYRATGNLDDAEREFRQALGRFEATLGDDHLQTMGAMHDLGTVHLAQGRYVEAEDRLTQANANIRRVLGADHPGTTKTSISVAVLYISQDRFDKAAPLLEAAFERLRATVDEDNFEVNNVKNNLGLVYRAQGRFEDAEPLLTQALESLRASFGETHFRTTSALFNLAVVGHDQGRYDEAERRYLAAHKSQTEGLGFDHTQTLTTRSMLARLYQDQGRFDQAAPLQRDALTSAREALGDHHPITLVAMNNLAVLHRRQSQYEEAEKLLDELISVYRRRHQSGETSIALRLGQSLVELAICRIGQQRFDEAQEIAAEAVELMERSEQSSWRMHEALSILGEAKMRKKKFAEAGPLLVDALTAMNVGAATIPQPYRQDVRTRTLQSLVQLYTDWGKPDEAAKWRSELPPN